jgi:hypothetical protein
MSIREDAMIEAYWKTIRGTLVKEFPAVRGSSTHGRRLIDAVIISDGEFRRCHWSDVDLKGKDVVVVQAKNERLGMYLMGQTLFSAELVRKFFDPKSVLSIALCSKDDSVLRPMLEVFPNMKVQVIEEF